MRRFAETLLFLSLALGIHLLLAVRSPEDGGDANGASGDAFVSITGAPASIETVLADWTAAPTHQAHMMSELKPQDVEFSDAPAPSLTLDEMPNAEVKIAALAPTDTPKQPDLELARTPLPPRPTVAAPVKPALMPPAAATLPPTVKQALVTPTTPPKQPVMQLSKPLIDNPIETPPPAPELPPKPAKKPETKPKRTVEPQPKKKVADKASTASLGAAPQKAAGAGNSAQAGSSKKSNALGKGKEASLMAAWARKIQSRLQRGVRAGKTKGAGARVVLSLTIATNGNLLNASISKSSGSAKLDQTVLASVRRIGRFAKAPKQLSKSSYGFSLPVRVK